MKKILLFFYPFTNFIFQAIFKRELNKATYLQIFKHYFVGFVSAILNYSIFNTFKYLGLDTTISNSITYIFVILFSFILQKYFTYKAKHNSIWQPILFLLNSFFYYVFDTALLVLLIDKLGIISLISKLITLLILAPLSFLSQKFIVFRKFNKEDSYVKS